MAKKGNIRIVDIAKMAEVSAGTVDRILHNRGKVSEDKKKKVEDVLKQLKYEPNLMARLLASKHRYSVVIVMPEFKPKEYWNTVYDGIVSAMDEMNMFNLSIEYLYFDQNNEDSFSLVMKQLSSMTFDGLIVATLFGSKVIELSQKMDEQEIPYIYIDSNIDGQHNLAYFGSDSYRSGAVAAKLMLKEIGLTDTIIIARVKTKNSSVSTQMRSREKGFRDCLMECRHRGKIDLFELIPEEQGADIVQLRALLKESSETVGGIVFNSRIFEFAALLDLMSEKERIKLVGYDSIEKNTNGLKHNTISYLISQGSYMQGYNGLKTLCHYLLLGKKPNKTNYMPIDILIQENEEYYNNHSNIYNIKH